MPIALGCFHKLRRQIGRTDCSSKHDIYDGRRRDHFFKIRCSQNPKFQREFARFLTRSIVISQF